MWGLMGLGLRTYTPEEGETFVQNLHIHSHGRIVFLEEKFGEAAEGEMDKKKGRMRMNLGIC
jgi:hypothetical protein